MDEQTESNPISPLVTSIVATLVERIQSGQYRDRHGFPSERELMETFQVSRTVIRKVLESLEAQELVLRSPRCRTVVRSPGSLSPPRQETKRRSIGLWLWPNSNDPAMANVLQGICQALDHEVYRLVIGNVVWDSWDSVCRSEARFLEQMTEDQDISGVLLWYLSGQVNLPALRKVRAANIPIVFMDRRPPIGFDADYVGIDNEHSAEEIVRHLIAQGHRRIAHITNGDNASTVAERLAGYRQALTKAQIPFQPELVVQANEGSLQAAAAMHAELAERLLCLPDPPTAAFAVNDVLAERFITALTARGLRVPEDMAVAGFDGIERWTRAKPFLTTMHQPLELIGKRAAKLLLQRMEAGPSTAYQHILLDTPLSVHGSTRPARRDSSSD